MYINIRKSSSVLTLITASIKHNKVNQLFNQKYKYNINDVIKCIT